MNLLGELWAYSQRENIETAREVEHILFELKLSKDGFVDLTVLDKPLSVPRVLKDRSAGVEPRQFYDNVKYTLMPGKHFEAFWDLVETQGPSRASTAVKIFRSTEKKWSKIVSKKLDEAQKLLGNDKKIGDALVVVTVHGVKGYLHDLPEAAPLPSLLEADIACCVTGEVCKPIRLHPSVKDVPKTQKGRVPLVSYNAPVYQFEGREQGNNFPVSPEVALGYTAALSSMLVPVDPENGRRRASGVELPDGRVLLMWAESVDLGPIFDVATCYHSKTTPKAVDDAWARFEAMSPSSEDVRILILQGYSGRISILRWERRPYNEVVAGIRRYREDFRQVTKAPALLSLMNGLEAERQLLSNSVKSAVYEAFLLNEPLPRALYSFTVDRMVGSLEPQKNNQSWSNTLSTKIAWVNSYLRRKNMTVHTPPEVPLYTKPEKSSFFPTTMTPAFQEGRWLAVLEQLQYLYTNRRGSRAYVNSPFGLKLHEYSLNTRRTKTEIQTRYLPLYLEKIGGWEKGQECRAVLEEISQALAQSPTPRRSSMDQRADIARGYEAQRLYFKRMQEYISAIAGDDDTEEVEKAPEAAAE